MFSISSLQAIAIAEVRTTSKLIRTWVIVAIAFSVAGYMFWEMTQLHAISSSVSPSLGFLSPRYLSSYTGELLLIFELGIISLMINVRSRDLRDRIVEVLDSKPVSNLELLAGRLLGNTILLSATAMVLVGLISAMSWGLYLYQAPFGDILEPYSVVSFLALDLVPNLALWGAIALLATLLIRSTLISALLAMIAAVATYFLTAFAPMYLSPAVAKVTSAVIFPSDLAPQLANTMIVGNRMGMIFTTLGILILGSLLYPRRDGVSKRLLSFAGTIGLFLGGLILSTLVLNVTASRSEFNRLVTVHKTMSNEPRADILNIAGLITIHPGQNLEVNYEISSLSPRLLQDELIFAFNPGMELKSLRVADKPVPYTFEDGLIYIPTSGIEPNQVFKLSLSAVGSLDTTFGYLDTKLNEYTANAMEGRAISLLGSETGIFHPEFVALTPGIKWYPTAGTAFGEDNYERFPRDYFTVDLEVVAPAKWTIAGPELLEKSTTNEQVRFRFAPQTAVPEVGLFGAQFVQRSITIAGVDFTLLTSPKHTRNLNLFAASASVIEERLNESLNRASELGIAYPYRALSIVEVPSTLRIYGGGWRMDSVQALPGVLMMRETGFPIARFEQKLNSTRKVHPAASEIPNVLYQLLEVYLENDLSGGNPFVGATKNLLDYQTYPTGRGATALAYMTNALTLRLVTSQIGFFSPYVARDHLNFGYIAAVAQFQQTTQGEAQRIAYLQRNYAINRPHIWDTVSNTALADLNSRGDSEQSYNAFILKCELLADLLVDALGADEIGRLLSAIRNRHHGSSYTVADFNQIADELQIPINAVLGDWLNSTSLAGFQAYHPKAVRLPDDSEGNSVYQTTFYLTNEEPVAGHVKIAFESEVQSVSTESSNETSVQRIDGPAYMQVALHSNDPISTIHVKPYLSLNRYWITLEVESPNSANPQDVEKLPLLSHVDWRPRVSNSIIVDDLDDGFSVSGTGSQLTANQHFHQKLAHYRGAVFGQLEYDKGLPTASSFGKLPEPQWYRYPSRSAWGKYRRTTTFVREGVFGSVARFRARLPSAGMWELEFHDPIGVGDFPVQSQSYGDNLTSQKFPLTIVADDQSFPIEYDQATSSLGWNSIDKFSLPSGVVDVRLEHNGVNVHADAIRWSSLSTTN